MSWGAQGRDGAEEAGSHNHVSPQFQEAGQGSLCNQAIMLITDGAVEDYEPVLEKYNWPDRKVPLGEGCRGRGAGGVPPPAVSACLAHETQGDVQTLG